MDGVPVECLALLRGEGTVRTGTAGLEHRGVCTPGQQGAQVSPGAGAVAGGFPTALRFADVFLLLLVVPRALPPLRSHGSFRTAQLAESLGSIYVSAAGTPTQAHP